jgi:predicted nucleotidyltransferase component of viral defense system
MDKIYVDTVRLLLDTAPHVFHSDRFALKGGTALNLFVREMPRLSVDIDVVYTDHPPHPRSEIRKQRTLGPRNQAASHSSAGASGTRQRCFQPWV